MLIRQGLPEMHENEEAPVPGRDQVSLLEYDRKRYERTKNRSKEKLHIGDRALCRITVNSL